jgi:tetratricopeptide (TPR) repeat protein
VLGGAVALIGFLIVRVGATAITRNLRSLSHLAAIAAGRPTGAAPIEGCPDYLNLVAVLADARLPVGERLARGEAEMRCLPAPRQQLLSFLLARLYGDTGDARQACLRLQSLGAADEIVRQGESSLKREDYARLATYLGCLESPAINPARVPDWRISQLYDRLGAHLAAVGDRAGALDAYGRAIGWNPRIGANSYQAVAKLMAESGQGPAAVGFLAAAAQDPALADLEGFQFYLWRDAGLMLEAEERRPEAACAFDRALALAGPLSPNVAPQEWRADLAARRARIGAQIHLDAGQCAALLDSLVR